MRRKTAPSNVEQAGTLVMLVTACLASARADVVETVGGETIVGHVQSMENGQLTVAPQGPGAYPPRTLALADVDGVQFYGKPDPAAADMRLMTTRGAEPGRTLSASVKLRKGLHRFELAYWPGPKEQDARVLKLEYSAQSMSRRQVPTDAIYRWRGKADQGRSPGLDAAGYRLPDNPPNKERKLVCGYMPIADNQHLESVKDFSALNDISPGGEVRDWSLGPPFPTGKYVCIFAGLIEMPADGEYTFYVTSDYGAQFYLGSWPKDFGTAEPASETPPWQVRLAGDGRLAGSIEGWTDQTVTVRFPAGGKQVLVEVPAAKVREVWSPEHRDGPLPIDRAGEPADQDSLYVVVKDDRVQRVPGLVVGVDGKVLIFRYKERDRRLALSHVAGFVLAGSEQEDAGPTDGFHQVIELVGGQRIPGRWLAVAEDTVRFETFWGPTLELARDAVAEVANKSGRLVWLSDLDPVRVEEVPYFDRMMPYRVDESLTGGPISLTDGRHQRGIAVHSRTVLDYDLAGRFERLVCRLGFQQPEGRQGNVSARVLGDGKVLFASESLSGTDPPAAVECDVSGVQRLELEVDFGRGQDVGDRVVWADARLIRSEVPK